MAHYYCAGVGVICSFFGCALARLSFYCNYGMDLCAFEGNALRLLQGKALRVSRKLDIMWFLDTKKHDI